MTLAVALVPGVLIALGICAAADIRDLDNAGFAVYVCTLTAVTVLLWLGSGVRFTADAVVVQRMWLLRRRIPWSDVSRCEFIPEAAPASESNSAGGLVWLSLHLRDGKSVGLVPIHGGPLSGGRASTPLGRRTERLVAIALAQLHLRGVKIWDGTTGLVSLADVPAVRYQWARFGLDPDASATPHPGL